MDTLEVSQTLTNMRVMCSHDPKEVLGMFWDGHYGVIHGSGHMAYSKDFPEGAKLKITAKIELEMLCPDCSESPCRCKDWTAEDDDRESKRQPWNKLTISAMAIIHLHEIGQLSEGQAMTLMNSPDIVSYRLTRERLTGAMRDTLRVDAERHGWKL